MTAPTTFPAALAAALRSDPGRPFVTFYDEATGERVELSVTTYANWVAKASSLLVDEHGLERGQSLRVDLPTHWLAAVFLGAAWNTGLVATDEDDPDAVVCGPDTLAAWQTRGPEGAAGPVLASALLPLGVRFAEPLPPGVHDVGVEIWGQPDSFIPWDPPEPEDPATRWQGVETTQQALLDAGGTAWGAAGARLLSQTAPAGATGALSVAGPLVTDGSVVLVAGADTTAPDRVTSIAETERVTGRFPHLRAEESVR